MRGKGRRCGGGGGGEEVCEEGCKRGRREYGKKSHTHTRQSLPS